MANQVGEAEAALAEAQAALLHAATDTPKTLSDHAKKALRRLAGILGVALYANSFENAYSAMRIAEQALKAAKQALARMDAELVTEKRVLEMKRNEYLETCLP